MDIKYSIVIPAYNAEKTLSRCLDSTLTQAYKNLEVIVVNDGSKDGTEALIRDYAQKDSRVRCLTKPNGGVSSARNMGLDAVTGDAIVFVDADDYLDPCFSQVLMWKDKADLMVTPFVVHEQTGTADTVKITGDDIDLVRNDMMYPIAGGWTEKGYSFASPCSKIYRSDIIRENHIRFKENLSMGEDLIFNLYYMEHISSILCLPRRYYVYCDDNQGSASRGYHEKFYLWDIEFQKEVESYITQYNRTALCKGKCLSAMNGLYRCATHYAHPQNKQPLTDMVKQMQDTLPSDVYFKNYDQYRATVRDTFGLVKSIYFSACRHKFFLCIVAVLLKCVSVIRRLGR